MCTPNVVSGQNVEVFQSLVDPLLLAMKKASYTIVTIETLSQAVRAS